MLSKRVSLLLLLLAIVLLGGAVSTVYLLRLDPLPSSFSDFEIKFGPLRMVSPFLRDLGSSGGLTPSSEDGIETRELGWKDAESQKLFGPVRVVAFWSDKPPRSWLRAGSICSFLLERYGEADGFMAIPGFTGMNLKDMHVCQLASRDGERAGLYVFSLPTPRCKTSALVFARIPWHFAEQTAEHEALNALMEERKAKIFNALGPVEIAPSANCQETMKGLAWGVVVAPLVVFVAACVLFGILWRRSA